MGLEFLGRIRRTAILTGVVSALMAAVYASAPAALGIAAGCAWSLVNFALLQLLVVALTGPGRDERPAAVRAAIAIAGLLALFAAGAALLVRLPLAWLMFGFFIPFTVMLFKAVSLLVIQSSVWVRMARHPRRSGAVLLVLAVAAWAALAWATGGEARDQATAENVAVSEVETTSEQAGEPAGEHADEEAGEGAAVHAAPGSDGETEAHGGGHGEEEGPQKFANFITVLARAFPEAGWAHFLHEYEVIIFALLIALAICIVAGVVARQAKMIPGPLQNAVEMLFEGLRDFVVGILGEKHGQRFVPFLGTLFIYILFMNFAGLVPFLESPTSNLNVTVALALTVFVYSQWVGFRELGVVGWLDHLAGNPRTLIGWLLVPLMLPIHILGEIAKPISLAARLFGNVFGEDMLLVAFASLGVTVLAFTGLPVGLPLHLPFLFLALLTSTLQALVFTVLSTIYILLMLPHDDHEESHAEAVQHAHG